MNSVRHGSRAVAGCAYYATLEMGVDTWTHRAEIQATESREAFRTLGISKYCLYVIFVGTYAN
jgi:hypothetical protein